jgi:hypothetical protein
MEVELLEDWRLQEKSRSLMPRAASRFLKIQIIEVCNSSISQTFILPVAYNVKHPAKEMDISRQSNKMAYH